MLYYCHLEGTLGKVLFTQSFPQLRLTKIWICFLSMYKSLVHANALHQHFST